MNKKKMKKSVFDPKARKRNQRQRKSAAKE